MAMIIFLRHGQAKNNTERILAGRSSGVNLTEEGILQVQNIAKIMKPLPISAVYSSPIQRAKNTAEIVARSNSINYSLDDRLIELEMGKFTGMHYDDIFSKHGNVFLKYYEEQPDIIQNGVDTEIYRKKILSKEFITKYKNTYNIHKNTKKEYINIGFWIQQ